MQTIRFTTHVSNGAYSYAPGMLSTVSPDEAARMVNLKYAELVESPWEKAIGILKEVGCGLLYDGKANADFVEAAKASGLSVRKK